MTTYSLRHRYTTKLYKSGVVKNVTNTQDYIKACTEFAKKCAPNEEEYINYRGMAFEVFVEYFIAEYGKHPDVGIVEYKPSKDKYAGPDGVGKDVSLRNDVVVQAKFKSNPKDKVRHTELGIFANDALANYGLYSENQAKCMNDHFSAWGTDKELHSTMHNMVLITTAYEASYHYTDVNKGSRVIGLNHLEAIIGNNNRSFWNGFRESLEISARAPSIRTQIDPHKFQIEAISKSEKFILSNRDRGQWILACGFGKTYVERKAIDYYLKTNPKHRTCAIFAPTIALTKQHIEKIYGEYSPTPEFDPVCVCSDNNEIEFYNKNEGIVDVKITMDINEIKDLILQDIYDKTNTCFFCTYHSAPKLTEALKLSDEDGVYDELNGPPKFGLLVFDEAHKVVGKEFNKIIDVRCEEFIEANKYMFFTGTRRTIKQGYRGMENHDLFGKVEIKVTSKDLIDHGLIVKPVLHLMKTIDDKQLKESSYEIATIIEAAKKHRKINNQITNNDVARIIVFCEDAHTQPESMVRNNEILNELPEFYVAAITAKGSWERVPNSTTINRDIDRKEIFGKFENNTHSILLHYNILSEGIDLPGANGDLMLRGMGELSSIQAIHRPIRLDPKDRESLKNGTITVESTKGWLKPYAWIIIPDMIPFNRDAMRRFEKIIKDVSEHCNYDMTIKDVYIPDLPDSDEYPDPNNKNLEPDKKESSKDIIDLFGELEKIRHYFKISEIENIDLDESDLFE